MARIQHHLDGALDLLDARDTSTLSPAARLTRTLLRAELARYRDRGVFPNNHDFDGLRPSFVDPHGTRCAMAHLMELGGAAHLVAEVAAGANHAYVHELAADARLVAWLAAAGLDVAEAARIQPGYCQSPARALCVVAPPDIGQAAAAVVEATILSEGKAPGPAQARVDALYGSAPFAVGATIEVRSTAVAVSAGDRVLVPVLGGAEESSYVVLVKIEPDGVVGARVNPEYSGWDSSEVGPLTPAEVIALREQPSRHQCAEMLVAKDPCYNTCQATRTPTEGICVYRARASAPTDAADASAGEEDVGVGALDAGSGGPPEPSGLTSAPLTDNARSCAASHVGADSGSVAVLLAVVGALGARQRRRH